MADERRSMIANAGLIAGPAIALAIGFGPPLESGQPQLNGAAAVAALMAVWWFSDALPLAITALLPLILFPALRIMSPDEVTSAFGDTNVFLFLGGFLIATVIEESGLHRRLALGIVSLMGDNPRRIVLGFMIATGGLSMWLTNSATTLMMLPIALSLLKNADHLPRNDLRAFNVSLLLGIAYSASIGGTATTIGTLPNVYFQRFSQDAPVSFGAWMLYAGPFALAFMLVAWLLMTRVIFRLSGDSLLGGRNVIRDELRKLGPMSDVEIRAAIVFAAAALLWIFREPMDGWGWAPLLGWGKAPGRASWVQDSTVAVFMAVVCFLIPAGRIGGPSLLTWTAASRLPWGILILFGGGVALANGMEMSGLSEYFGAGAAARIDEMPPLARVATISGLMIGITELTSNIATAQIVLPILRDTALQLHMDPRTLMAPATLAVSCAFMLPVATPPNAIVYGSGRIRIGDMVKAGFWLNCVGVVLVTLVTFLIGVPILGWK